MAAAVGSESNERRFCWEQVLRTNPAFRVSHVFAPSDQAGQLLPLYALFAAVEEVSAECTDDDVARRKLQWWRSECARLQAGEGDHPISRELRRTGAHRKLRRKSLEQLLDDAEQRLDAAAPSDTRELRMACLALSRPQFELELSLSGEAESADAVVNELGATSGLAQLLRESARRQSPGRYWWLPLSLLARHGVGRATIDERPNAEPVAALFAELFAGYREWGEPPVSGGLDYRQLRQAARHLFVVGQLQRDAVARIGAMSPRDFLPAMNRAGLPQVYQAWKAARSFNRR
jgi:phytoene/squalene synthetase